MHQREIKKFANRAFEQGLTLVPLRMYFVDGRAKVEIGLAKGKRQFEKRHESAGGVDAELSERQEGHGLTAWPPRRRALARSALRYDLYAALAGLTSNVLTSTSSTDSPAFSTASPAFSMASTRPKTPLSFWKARASSTTRRRR